MGQNVDNNNTSGYYYKELKIQRYNQSWIPSGRIINKIDPWCVENLKGQFAIFHDSQYFEFEEDLIMFTLRWDQ